MDESSHSSPSLGTPSMKLKRDDVLLGRGAALAQFEGNLRFRDLVDERKDEYTRTSMRKEKKRIAKEIYDLVTSRGGRFLKQDGSEATVDTAIEKCKQALRENRLPTVGKKRDQTDITNQSPRPSSTTGSGDNDVLSSELGSAADFISLPIASPIALPDAVPDVALNNETLRRAEIGHETTASTAALPCGFASIPPSSHSSMPSVLSIVDPRLLLFRGSLMQPVLQKQVWIPQSAETTNPVLSSDTRISSANTLPPEVQSQVKSLMSINIAAAVAHQRYLAAQAMYSMLRDFARLQTCNGHMGRQTLDEELSESLVINQDDSNGMAMIKLEKTSNSQAKVAPAAKDEAQTNDAQEEEVAAFLLSSLSVVDRPVITEEQEAMEKAELTDQEKASILADAFGDMCNVNPHQSKKAKTDLDKDSIAFLVRQMVFEIEKIPLEKRVSLMEALSKGLPEEFSDKRLEMFLRCEGMNTKLAAERFVNYWEGRRQVFGAEKYRMRMTLSEALKEDLVALDTCVYTLLPHRDLSGRQILYMEPHRHSRKGYTSESMLRAIWYVSEIAAQENTNVSNGIVQVCWFENSSLFDYDLKVFDRWAYFLSSCWPLKLISNHLCCPTTIVNRIVKPIIHTFVSRDFRNRTLTHNVSAEDIITVLSKYGISQDMLPSEMGGNLRCHQSEWLANRRASEMEEI